MGLNRLFISVFKLEKPTDRNRVLKKADYVTTISPWHVDILKQYNTNVELIYNGFDPELFYPEQKKTEKFIITYTGRLLSTAMRNPGLLFEALSILSARNILTPDKCRVYWYVDETSCKIITEEAEKIPDSPFYGFQRICSGVEIPSILNSSSVLLLLTNHAANSGPKGVMTTKFLNRWL